MNKSRYRYYVIHFHQRERNEWKRYQVKFLTFMVNLGSTENHTSTLLITIFIVENADEFLYFRGSRGQSIVFYSHIMTIFHSGELRKLHPSEKLLSLCAH